MHGETLPKMFANFRPLHHLLLENARLFELFERKKFIAYQKYIMYTALKGPVHLLLGHRRRIDLEDKAKVVASDGGKESLPHLPH